MTHPDCKEFGCARKADGKRICDKACAISTERWAVEVSDCDGPSRTYRLLAVQVFDTEADARRYAQNNRDSYGRLPAVRPAFPNERSWA